MSLGVPLFALLALASGPLPLRTVLAPIVAVALAMTALIVFDEVRYVASETRVSQRTRLA